jgi:cell wall-associated NlpC family hydrolase
VNAAAGELLFFSDRSDGAITHVGIAAGAGEMLHVALGRGGYYVENFSDGGGSDRFTADLLQRFRFARLIWSGD